MAQASSGIPGREMFATYTTTGWSAPASATFVSLGIMPSEGTDIGKFAGRDFEIVDKSNIGGGGTIEHAIRLLGESDAAWTTFAAKDGDPVAYVWLMVLNVERTKATIYGGAIGGFIRHASEVPFGGEYFLREFMFSVAGLKASGVQKTVSYPLV